MTELNIEYAIMEALWSQNRAMNRNQIFEYIMKCNLEIEVDLSDLAQILRKMVRNNYVSSQEINNVYHYAPLIDKKGYNKIKINKKLNNAYGMNFEELLLIYMGLEVNEDNLASLNNFLNNI